MYAKLILLPILLIGSCAGQNQSPSIDDLINSVFDMKEDLPNAITTQSPVTQTDSLYSPCGAGKMCVLKYLCSSKGQIINNGETLIGPRMSSIDTNPCPFNEVCCATSDSVNEPPIREDDLLDSFVGRNSNLPDVQPDAIITQSPVIQTDSLYSPCGSGKVCVLQYLCSSKGQIINNGDTLIGPRMSSIDNNSCPFLQVCCATGDTVNEPPIREDEVLDSIFRGNSNQPNMQPVAITTQSPVIQTDSLYSPCGAGKVCVRQYLCSSKGQIVKNGETLIGPRMSSIDNNPCPFLEVCCATGDGDTINEPPISPEHVTEGCGFRNEDGVGVKLRGSTDNIAEYGEFPWMVAILKSKVLGTKLHYVYKCGGSLISEIVVLTAAHCVVDKQAHNLLVRVGEWESNTNAEPFSHQDIKVKEIITHENFNTLNLYNDVALLFFEEPFNWAPHVNTICLPPAGTNFDKSRCFVTGWGKDQFQNGRYSSIMKKINLPIVQNAKCQRDLRKTLLGRSFKLHSSFICAGGEHGKDTCQGDGGSPLVCPMPNNPNRYFQAGIVAGGMGCGEENVPGIYASVPQLRIWIDNQLADKGIDDFYFSP